MILHGTGKDTLFDVAALANEISRRVGMADMFDILASTRPCQFSLGRNVTEICVPGAIDGLAWASAAQSLVVISNECPRAR